MESLFAMCLLLLFRKQLFSQGRPSRLPCYFNNYVCGVQRLRSARAARIRRFRMRQAAARHAFIMLSGYSRSSIRSIWVRQRSGVWWQHVLKTWGDREWLQNFRMRRTTFMKLCDILRPHLKRDSTRFRSPVPVEQRVAICIWRLATNVEYRSISHLFGIGLSTACAITNHVASVIVDKLLSLYIRTPSEDEFKTIIQGFSDRWGFPQCGGAIDGTHIGILAPPDTPADYYNHKGFYSVILQGVVDHQLRFWDINVGWPGRVHDARVFGNSSVYDRGQSGKLFPNLTERIVGVDVPVVMLGDAAYPLLTWLMKPYPESNATPAQKTFNYRLSKAQMTVERAFGRLKGRWRCLMKRYDCHMEKINAIITACCVLHNFCEVNNEDYDDDDFEVCRDEAAEWNPLQTNTTANATRDALCSYFPIANA